MLVVILRNGADRMEQTREVYTGDTTTIVCTGTWTPVIVSRNAEKVPNLVDVRGEGKTHNAARGDMLKAATKLMGTVGT